MKLRLAKAVFAVSAFLLTNATAEPLEEAVLQALETNPALLAQKAQLQAIEQSVASARAQGLPEISIGASTELSSGSFDPGEDGQQLFTELFPEGFGDSAAFDALGGTNTHQAQLSVTQPLFTGFRIKNGIKEAKATVQAARAQYEMYRQNTAFQIASAYLAVTVAEARIESVEKSLESLQEQARAAAVSFEIGQATRTDTALADARLAAVNARLAGAKAQWAAARNDYQALAGDLPTSFEFGTVSMRSPGAPDQAVVRALRNNPRVLAAEAVVMAREAARAAAKGERSPNIRLRGTLGYVENNFIDGDQSENATLTAELSMPLFQGGAIGANIRRTKADARASRFSLTETQRQVEADVRTAYAQLQAARIAREATDAQVTAAELAYRGAVLEQEVGQRSLLDVLDVEEDLLEARFSSLDSQRAEILAVYQLRLAIGELF